MTASFFQNEKSHPSFKDEELSTKNRFPYR